MLSHPTRSTFARTSTTGVRPRVIRALVALVTTALIAAPLIGASPALAATSSVALGAATSYSVLGHETVTNTGNTVVGGDLGVSPGTSVTGFGPGRILANGGNFHSADSSSAAAQAALTTAYNDAASRPLTSSIVTGDYQLGGRTFGPGVYGAASSAQITGTVTLDGGGDPNAVFIFQMGSTLTTAAGSPSIPASIVKLINGAKPANVFWQVGSSATLGTYSYFSGTIMALASVTVTTGAHVRGRALASTGAVTLDDDDFASAPPSFSSGIKITSSATSSTATPTISGTADASNGTLVTVTVTPTTGPAITLQATVTGGTWSVPSSALANGTYTVVATVIDSAGNPLSDTQTLTVDTTTAPPGSLAIAITSSVASTSSTPTISGSVTAPNGSNVVVTVKAGATPVEIAAATITGSTWSLLSSAIPNRSYTILATVTDPSGNTRSDTQSLVVSATLPTIQITPIAPTNNATPTISGTLTAPDGSTVAVTINSVYGPLVQTLRGIISGSTWTTAAAANLTDGVYTIGATVTDPATNTARAATQALVINTGKPVIAITSPNPTNVATPAISGTSSAADGSAVVVTITPATGPVETLNAIVTGNRWTTPASTPLADGSYPVTATVTDTAGNVGSSYQLLGIDTSVPTIAITSKAATNSKTPTISGTLFAPTGSHVAVTISSTTSPFIQRLTGLVTGGTWSTLASLPVDGTYTVNATVTNPAGTTGSALPQTLVVDSTVPTIVITSSSVTNQSTPLISGTLVAPTGSYVSVTISASPAGPVLQTLTGVVSGTPGTTWSAQATTALADGTYIVNATVTNPAGTNGRAVPQTLLVEATAPVIAITSPSQTNNSTPTISGVSNAPDTSQVTVTITPVSGPVITLPTTTVLNHVWAVLSPTLVDGTYTVGATVIDPAHNVGTATPQNLVVNTSNPVIVITSPAITNQSRPTIFGTTTAEVGQIVSVFIGDEGRRTPVLAGGIWSLVSDYLSEGANPVHVTVINKAGNSASDHQSLVLDTSVPTIAITSNLTTNNANPVISGTLVAPTGSTVSVTVRGVFTTQTLVGTVSGATWTATSSHLSDGLYTVVATVTNPAKSTGTDTKTLTIDTTTPVITIDTLGLKKTPTPTISGTALVPDGTVVHVTIDGVPVVPAPTVTRGVWSVVSPPLTDGTHVVRATVTNPAGTTGTAAPQRVLIDTSVPTILITSKAITNHPMPTVLGTFMAPPGSTVSVTVASSTGVLLETLTADILGRTWSAPSTVRLTDGTYTINATVTSPAGNQGTAVPQTLLIDTVAPTVSIALLGVTNNSTPTLSGLANVPDNTFVAVSVSGLPLPLPAVVIGGTWSVVSPRLAEGAHTVDATVTDAAGNIGTALQRTVTIDTTAPIIAITSSPLSNTTTPIIFGTSNAPDGSTVIVTVDGVSLLPSPTVTGRKWSIPSTPLTVGPHAITATTIDPAGNAGTALQTLVVDTTDPLILITSPALTNKSTPVISGTSLAPVGSDVTVTVGTVTLAPTKVLTGGSWSIVSPALTEGANQVTAVVSASGKTSSATQSLVLDTTKPLIAITSLGGATTQTPIIFGTTDAPTGSIVTVTVDGIALSPSPLVIGSVSTAVASVTAFTGRTLRAVVATGGTWSVLSRMLTKGTHSVVASVSDRAGNTASDSESLTVTDPSTPIDQPNLLISSPSTAFVLAPVISGTSYAPAGTVVSVSVDGVNLPTTTLASDGTWSVLSRPLAEGAHSVVASLTAAGGSATASQTLTVATQLVTHVYDPAEVALARTGGNLSADVWGLLFLVLGGLAFLGRSMRKRAKSIQRS